MLLNERINQNEEEKCWGHYVYINYNYNVLHYSYI